MTEGTDGDFDGKKLNAMVGRYTMVIVFIICAGLMCMGFGWPWWLAGLGPIVLIPLAGVSFAMALELKIKERQNG
jgi:hypothetical protein